MRRWSSSVSSVDVNKRKQKKKELWRGGNEWEASRQDGKWGQEKDREVIKYMDGERREVVRF